MAEGYLKYFCGEKAAVYSAAYDPQGINSRAKASMQEDDIDMDGHQSNHILEYEAINFDFVITISDRAQNVLPKFEKSTQLIHKHFKDITNTKGVPQSVAQTFKTTREDIKSFCRSFYIEHPLSD
jgi:arsenate reductase